MQNVTRLKPETCTLMYRILKAKPGEQIIYAQGSAVECALPFLWDNFKQARHAYERGLVTLHLKRVGTLDAERGWHTYQYIAIRRPDPPRKKTETW